MQRGWISAGRAERLRLQLWLADNLRKSIARDVPLDLPLREARDVFDSIYFNYHMEKESGNMARVAQKVGLERTHLYRKLKQLGIKISRRESDEDQP